MWKNFLIVFMKLQFDQNLTNSSHLDLETEMLTNFKGFAEYTQSGFSLWLLHS